MNNKSKELENILITIRETSERDLDELSDSIDKIIECHITNERTISLIFDTILSIEFIEDDKKIKVFHKLSNYCRSFNEELADDYDKISQDDTLRIEHVYDGMDEGKMVLKDVTTGAEIPLSCSFTERQKAILKAGGLLKYVGQGNK